MSKAIVKGDTVELIGLGKEDAGYRDRKRYVGRRGRLIEIHPSKAGSKWKYIKFEYSESCDVFYQAKVRRIKP